MGGDELVSRGGVSKPRGFVREAIYFGRSCLLGENVLETRLQYCLLFVG